MAQRSPRPRPGAQPARAAAKSRKSAASEGEMVEDAPGIGVDAGLAILTTVALVAALVLVDMMQAKNGHGFLF